MSDRSRCRAVLVALVCLLVAVPWQPDLAAAAGIADMPNEETAREQAAALAELQAPAPPRTFTAPSGTAAVTHPLFVAVDDTTVPAYQIDPATANAIQAFVGSVAWGAAFDVANNRVLFNDGSTLYQWPVGGVVSALGTMTDVTGASINFVGFAFHNGTLYGVRNIANEAVYAIDTTTRVATVLIDYVDADLDLGGLAADPTTGELYATNDDTSPYGSGLFRINADASVTKIADYPAGLTDIDGLAISSNRVAYLVTDEPGMVYVYDLVAGAYQTPFANPWTSSEVFSAGTWIWEADQAAITLTKTVGTVPGVCAATDAITVPAGTTVYYCYQAQNTGTVTLSYHDLVDDVLGPLYNDHPLTLAPGATSPPLIVPSTPSATITNTATWTASNTLAGYAMEPAATYSYISINTTGTALALADDGEANITSPFAFTFMGSTSTDLRVGNNGGILFGVTTGDLPNTNVALPTATPVMAILPFWDDLDDETGDVYWEVQGTAPNRQLIIEWYNRPHYNGVGAGTFEVILYETTNQIRFQYADVDFGNSTYDMGANATVGLNRDATGAAQYSFNQAIVGNGQAILFTPETELTATDTDSATVTVTFPNIDVSPLTLASTQVPNSTASLPMAIGNTGAAPLTWQITETLPDIATRPGVVPAPEPVFNVPEVVSSEKDCEAFANYPGREPPGYAEFCHPEIGPRPGFPPHPATPHAPTDTGFAQDIGYISDNFVRFTLNNFTGQTVVGTSTDAIYGMDFDAAGTTLYALNDTTDQLGTINLTTGAFTSVVACPPPDGATNWTGMTIDPVTDTMYASTAANLYALDAATCSPTLIGPFNTSTMIDIAIGPAGVMYGHDIGTDSIYTISTTTGAATLVGPTGYAANYAQGMDFDNEDGTLYIFLYQGSGANIYGTVNLTTGAVTPIATSAPTGEFEGATQTQSGCVANDYGWLSLAPDSGTTAAASSTPVLATFDSTGLAIGGYTGQLCVRSNDPDTGPGNGSRLVVVPVSLTVEPAVPSISLTKTVGIAGDVCPATSSITVPIGTTVYYCYTVTNTGTVPFSAHTLVDDQLGTIFTGLAHALAPGASFNTVSAGVSIPAVITATTTNTGTWTAFNQSPTDGVQAQASATVTAVAPNMDVNPLSLTSAQLPGQTTTQPLNLTNTGTADLLWAVADDPVVVRPAESSAVDARTAPASTGSALPRFPVRPEAVVVNEGFEGAVVPPAGWASQVQNAGHTWKLQTAGGAYSGLHAADVEYDPALAPQDEWLLSPQFTAGAASVSFWSIGNPYWCRDDYDNCDLQVWLVVGATAGDGDDILVGEADPDWAGTWVWSQTAFDLTPLLPGGPVRLGFRYLGTDGAQIGLDAIVVNALAPGTCSPPEDVPWLSTSPITGTLAPAATQPVSVTFDSTGLTPATYSANLCVYSNDPDPAPGNGTELVIVPVTMTVEEPAAPSITLAKTVGTTAGVCAATSSISVTTGTTVYYCYTVTNTGNVALNLHDLVDDRLGTIFTGLAYALAPGASIDTVAAGLSIPAVITTTTTNTGTWTAYNTGPVDSTQAQASATVTALQPANVTGTKTVTGTYEPHGHITYTVLLTNAGPGLQPDAVGDEFTDLLPSTLTATGATASSGTALLAGNLVTWNGTIPAGGSVTITITATINLVAGGTTVSNQGTISYDSDGDGTNDATRLTDDPVPPGASDPTIFVVTVVEPIPAVDWAGLTVLILLLAGFAILALRRLG